MEFEKQIVKIQDLYDIDCTNVDKLVESIMKLRPVSIEKYQAEKDYYIMK